MLYKCADFSNFLGIRNESNARLRLCGQLVIFSFSMRQEYSSYLSMGLCHGCLRSTFVSDLWRDWRALS